MENNKENNKEKKLSKEEIRLHQWISDILSDYDD